MADDKPNQPKRRVDDAGFHTPSSCTSAASASPEVSLARPSGVSTQSGPWPQRDPQASPENSKRSSGLDYYAINATDETPGSCESSLMRPVDSKIDTTIRGRGDSDAKDPLDAPEPGIDPFDIQSASSSSIAPSFPSQTLPSSESATGSGLTSSASLDSVRSVFSAISGSSATSSSSLSPSRTRSSSRFMNPFTMIAGLIHRAGKWTRRLRLKKKHTPTGPATAHIANSGSAVDQPSPPAPTHASAHASTPVLHAVAAEEKSPLPDIPEELSVTLGSSIQSPAFSPKRSGRELNEDSGPQEQVPEELLNDSMLNSENDIIDMCHALSPASALPPLLLPTSASPPNSGPSSPVRPGEPNGDASSGEDQPEGADAANAGFTGARVRNERRPFALEQLVHQSHQRRSSEGL